MTSIFVHGKFSSVRIDISSDDELKVFQKRTSSTKHQKIRGHCSAFIPVDDLIPEPPQSRNIRAKDMKALSLELERAEKDACRRIEKISIEKNDYW
jgi:hypothetical protein